MHGTLYAINHKGDTRISWDSDVEVEVKAARKQFDELTKKGYAAFGLAKRGAKGDRIREFDPAMEEILLVPQMAGG